MMNDKMHLFLNKNKWKFLISILLILNVLVVFSFGARKNGYNVDELYTYGLSNSYFDPFIDVTKILSYQMSTFKTTLRFKKKKSLRMILSMIINQEMCIHRCIISYFIPFHPFYRMSFQNG